MDMTSQFDTEDDENWDDPIRLFPNGFDSSADAKWNCLVERHSESNSECTISPVFIKLVDCVQFPWYFRKYTAQILQKTDPNQFETETEQEVIDVEDCDSNSSDCFIVEDLHPDFTTTKDNKEIQKKIKMDNELQTALSQKQLSEIDLKRNIGLVGMKISQKKYTIIKENVSTAKKVTAKEVTAKSDIEEMRSQLVNNEKLNSSLTITVPLRINYKIPDNIINNLEEKEHSYNNNKYEDERLMISSAHKLSENVPTSTASKKPLNKSTSHVKNIKKCNKYKKDQLKSKNKTKSILIKMLASDSTTQKTCEVPELERNRCEQSDNRKNDQSDNIIEEPKSPILKCTTPKKLKPIRNPEFSKNMHTTTASKPELPPIIKCNNANINAHKNLDKIVKKLKILNKMPSSSITPKPCDLPMKNAPTKEIQEKTGTPNSVISKKLLQKLDKSIKNYNNLNKFGLRAGKLDKSQCIQSNSREIETSIPSTIVPTIINNNKILIPRSANCSKTNLEVKTFSSQLLSNQSKVLNTSNAVAKNNSSLATSNPNAKVVGTPKVSSTTVVKPSSSNNSSVPAYKSPSPNDCLKPQYIVHSLPKKLFHNNNKSANVSAQNRNESTKMLINKGVLSVGSKPEHPIHDATSQMASTFHNLQPQIQDPRSAYIYNSTILDNQRNNFPNSVNQCQPPSLSECHLPNNKIYRQTNQVPYFYPNRVWVPLPPPPPPMYVPPPYVYQNQQQSYSNSTLSASVPNQSLTSVSQDNTRTLQPSNTNNSSIIGVNTDGLVKKINIARGPQPPNVHPEGGSNNKNVGSKMSPSGHREEIASKVQKSDKTSLPDEDIGKKTGDKPINSTTVEQLRKVAVTSNNRGASETRILSVDSIKINMQIQQSKGYSPPILPIPTYHKVLKHVTPKSLAVSKDLQNINCIPKTSVINNDDFAKTNKRKDGALNIAENRRQFKAKKISLEEYNKRIVKVGNSVPCIGTVSDDKNNHNRKRPNVDKRNDREYSTETDLGYDSDSTVIL